MEKQYRNNGAIGALLDEYEKVINELILIIDNLTHEQLIYIVDHNAKDEDCKSIQTILTHIVQSGYTYVVEIRKWLGEVVEYRDKIKYISIDEYKLALAEMFNYNKKLFIDYPNLALEEKDTKKKILVRWGQQYDVEQLFEHAIVHVLRHRRQIEMFKIRMNQAD